MLIILQKCCINWIIGLQKELLMSDRTRHIDDNVRKDIFIPLAFTLLWIIGLSLALYLSLNKTKLNEATTEIQTVFKFGIVFVLFLWEIVFGFMDIGHSYANKQFSSKVFKTTAYILGDIALTIILVVSYIALQNSIFLCFFLLTTAFLKYIYIYISRNVGTYLAVNNHKPNFINHG